MITSSDIQTILYKKAKGMGIKDVYKAENVPVGELKAERVVVLGNSAEPGTYWKVGFFNVNISVPDLDDLGKANLSRLATLERKASLLFNDTSKHDTTAYTYEVDTTRIEQDTTMKCHYVNVRVLVKVINVK